MRFATFIKSLKVDKSTNEQNKLMLPLSA